MSHYKKEGETGGKALLSHVQQESPLIFLGKLSEGAFGKPSVQARVVYARPFENGHIVVTNKLLRRPKREETDTPDAGKKSGV